jgi:UDP-N-acetylmuramoylalanine--D-glutamate ligase
MSQRWIASGVAQWQFGIAMELQGKRVVVVGLGKSGVASSLFLAERGARVTATDAKPEAQLGSEPAQLRERGIAMELGTEQPTAISQADLVVVSPGVPFDAPALKQARSRKIPVIGEIELASRFFPGHLIAITGSNGKTTTTALTGDVVATTHETLVGGNIGTPAISLVPQASEKTWMVLEVSSFQLETIETFRPHIAVVLNVTPDHLDRHGSFEGYAAAKGRIFENQTHGDFAVLNHDDATCVAYASKTEAQVRWFSRLAEVEKGAFLRGGDIVWRDAAGERVIMRVDEIPLKGAHNVENVLAAVAAGILAGCEPAAIRKAVRAFKAVEHRLEFVANVRGVDYYNDSKATNVDATIKALEAFPANIHIILGGKDKGSDYTVLKPLLRERVKRVYTIGAAAEKIQAHIAGAVEIVAAGTIEEAVRRASEAAKPGDIVLLAPACASFDQFNNYEHRGRVFKDLVRQLAGSREWQNASA